MEPMISVKDLSVRYGDTVAVNKASFQLEKHSLTTIVGPNGGGKSSLLQAVMGLVGFDGKCHIATNNIAYLPQRARVDRSFPITVFEFVSYGLVKSVGFWGYMKNKDHIFEALATVGLKDYAEHSIAELSGGQFQRALFARLLLQDADLILLDEPFTAIDQHTTQVLLEIIHDLHQKKKTILSIGF